MPDQPADRPGPRQQLLDDAVALMAREGSGHWTLRRLAEALGTSHRMVIYHFGSLDGLLLEVVTEVERRQRARHETLGADLGDPLDAAREFWAGLADPSVAAHERLFFELYAAALQGREYAAPLLRGVVHDWLPSLTAAFAAATGDEAHAAADARLGVAVIRGLLLDLLATGDHEAVRAAHERYLGLYSTLRRPESPDAH